MAKFDVEAEELGNHKWMVTIDANLSDGAQRFVYDVSAGNQKDAINRGLKALKDELTAFANIL